MFLPITSLLAFSHKVAITSVFHALSKLHSISHTYSQSKGSALRYGAAGHTSGSAILCRSCLGAAGRYHPSCLPVSTVAVIFGVSSLRFMRKKQVNQDVKLEGRLTSGK